MDTLFIQLDQLVCRLEDEGHPFQNIVQVMRDYVELCEEFVLES